jgi:hypothetical protein
MIRAAQGRWTGSSSCGPSSVARKRRTSEWYSRPHLARLFPRRASVPSKCVEERALDEVNVVQALAEGRVADERGGFESHGPDEGVRPLHVPEEVLEESGSVHVQSLLESGGRARFTIPRSAASASEAGVALVSSRQRTRQFPLLPYS